MSPGNRALKLDWRAAQDARFQRWVDKPERKPVKFDDLSYDQQILVDRARSFARSIRERIELG